MICKVYLPQKWMYGDATAFYVDIIASAFRGKGYNVQFIDSTDSIDAEDTIVTVASFNVKEVYKKKPKRIINWFQGIAPEEDFLFLTKNKFKAIKKYIYLSRCDDFALRHCDFLFFVSERMREFYTAKYGYKRNNYFVMPCFNQPLHKQAFNSWKYTSPSFVYAGSMDGWQCFEKTVKLYADITKYINNATLTVLTKSHEEALVILNKYNVEADVKYVPYEKIDEELQKYKYGFIIRDQNIVNSVATPTKMNSYMANGVIPIYSDVVASFHDNLQHVRYAVPLGNNNSGIEQLFQLEEEIINPEDVLRDYTTVFNQYYSRDYYIEQLKNICFI